ncbi:YciN family protein [Aeromonas simiae]|uniref:DUF2498 family protein n=1 Tax=Aeromonas simiae TaxID=218936 RepID=A0A5J6WWF5_9GAMM|nr:YciN family protein [Aeromonas simiae]MDO2947020.1 YciN family protein [Aeromonas simiae]MDO2950632.1 YciN family protein [Aeromonas simiae]MDO2954386.1 YciN family protein [Aeromonas simiae]QFI55302.1 DUF2498 family protein [Aeromonas simiae]
MRSERAPISQEELLTMANRMIREHEDFIHGMQADAVEQRGDVLVFKGEYFLADDGTPTGKTMAVFNMFKYLAHQLSDKYQLV